MKQYCWFVIFDKYFWVYYKVEVETSFEICICVTYNIIKWKGAYEFFPSLAKLAILDRREEIQLENIDEKKKLADLLFLYVMS